MIVDTAMMPMFGGKSNLKGSICKNTKADSIKTAIATTTLVKKC